MILVLALLLSAPAFAEPSHPSAEAPELRASFEAQQADLDELRGQVDALRLTLAGQQAALEAMRSELADQVTEDRVSSGQRVTYGAATIIEAGERVHEAIAFGDDVVVHGHVLGDATSFRGDVIVRHGGVVAGDAVAFGGRVVVEDGGEVLGDRVPLSSSRALNLFGGGAGLLSSIYNRLVFMLSLAGAGVLVIGLFPERITRIAQSVSLRPFRSGVVGLVAAGLLTVAGALFALTIVGIPVTLLLILLLGAAWLMGFVGLCQALGDRLPFREPIHGRWAAFLLGTLLVTFIGAMPLVGGVSVGIMSVLGLGAALSTRYGAS